MFFYDYLRTKSLNNAYHIDNPDFLDEFGNTKKISDSLRVEFSGKYSGYKANGPVVTFTFLQELTEIEHNLLDEIVADYQEDL